MIVVLSESRLQHLTIGAQIAKFSKTNPRGAVRSLTEQPPGFLKND
jgi:hypothetical protein